MTDIEAEEAIKTKIPVRVGPADLMDVPGQTHHSVLMATGRLVSRKKQGEKTTFLFTASTGERTEGPASMFRPYPA